MGSADPIVYVDNQFLITYKGRGVFFRIEGFKWYRTYIWTILQNCRSMAQDWTHSGGGRERERAKGIIATDNWQPQSLKIMSIMCWSLISFCLTTGVDQEVYLATAGLQSLYDNICVQVLARPWTGLMGCTRAKTCDRNGTVSVQSFENILVKFGEYLRVPATCWHGPSKS